MIRGKIIYPPAQMPIRRRKVKLTADLQGRRDNRGDATLQSILRPQLIDEERQQSLLTDITQAIAARKAGQLIELGTVAEATIEARAESREQRKQVDALLRQLDVIVDSFLFEREGAATIADETLNRTRTLVDRLVAIPNLDGSVRTHAIQHLQKLINALTQKGIDLGRGGMAAFRGDLRRAIRPMLDALSVGLELLSGRLSGQFPEGTPSATARALARRELIVPAAGPPPPPPGPPPGPPFPPGGGGPPPPG